jgi:hypothetical protein
MKKDDQHGRALAVNNDSLGKAQILFEDLN